MKNRVVIAIFVGLLLIGVAVTFSTRPEPDPRDLSYWMRAAAGKDWSAEAAQNKPEAQFCLGLTLIRSNLVTMIDRVPWLSAVPLIGRRLFEKHRYGIDDNIDPEQLAEAFGWIKRAADQGHAAAKETQKLFIGRVGMPNRPVEPTRRVSEQPKQ